MAVFITDYTRIQTVNHHPQNLRKVSNPCSWQVEIETVTTRASVAFVATVARRISGHPSVRNFLALALLESMRDTDAAPTHGKGTSAASDDQSMTMVVPSHLSRAIRLRDFVALDLDFQRTGPAAPRLDTMRLHDACGPLF